MIFFLSLILVGRILDYTLAHFLNQRRLLTTEYQIRRSFELMRISKFDTLIIGNSRVYRGVDPEVLSTSSFNFSHDNDSFNQIYYKLLVVLDNHQIKTLVLGVDYFQFSVFSDSRNYAYYNQLSFDYLKDYSFLSNLRTIVRRMLFPQTYDVTSSIGSVLSRKTDHWLELTQQGQLRIWGIHNGGQGFDGKRESNRLTLQDQYFNKILKLCKSQDIELKLLMMPCQEKVLTNYHPSDIAKFDHFFESQVSSFSRGEFLNFSSDEDFSPTDFNDLTHLSPEAATRFSKKLNDRLEKD